MISLDLTKSSEVRIAGDQPNYVPFSWNNPATMIEYSVLHKYSIYPSSQDDSAKIIRQDTIKETFFSNKK